MYEPTYPPKLDQKSTLLSGLRFHVLYENKFIQIGDSSIEPAHIHDCYELFFNVAAEVSFLVNNRIYPLEHGDAVLTCVNQVHVCIYNKTCTHTFFCLWIEVEDDHPVSRLLKQASYSPHLTFDHETRSTIRALLTSLSEVADESEKDVEKAALLLQLLTLLDKRQGEKSDVISVPAALQKILDDVNENFAEIRHINDIVESHFVSTATLNRWFKRYLHISPREFLESKKLSHAAGLLAKGESVTNACMRSGFSECSHFIRRFKMKFGETPLKYKQKFE